MFSLPEKKNCFYKVTWVYKERVAACWQSNMDYSLEARQSPKKMCPSPPERQLLKKQWIKAFFGFGFVLFLCLFVQIRMLEIKSPKIKPSKPEANF